MDTFLAHGADGACWMGRTRGELHTFDPRPIRKLGGIFFLQARDLASSDPQQLHRREGFGGSDDAEMRGSGMGDGDPVEVPEVRKHSPGHAAIAGRRYINEEE